MLFKEVDRSLPGQLSRCFLVASWRRIIIKGMLGPFVNKQLIINLIIFQRVLVGWDARINPFI